MTNYTLIIDEETFDIAIGSIQGSIAQVTVNQVPYTVKIDASSGGQVALEPSAQPKASTASPATPVTTPVSASQPKAAGTPKAGGKGVVSAPIPGKILFISVRVGDKVSAGQVVAVIEAMKMENDLLSPIDGTVQDIVATKDSDVGTGDVILIIE